MKKLITSVLLFFAVFTAIAQRNGIIDADTTRKSNTGLSIAYINKELVVNIDIGNLKAKFMRKDSILNRLALKANINNPTFAGTVSLPTSTSIGSVSSSELSTLDGVSSNIQTQLSLKAPIESPTFSGTVSLPPNTSIGSVTSTDISRIAGLTDNVQTQFGNKVDKISGKGLSTNDYSNDDKSKLTGLVSGQVLKGNWNVSTNNPTLTTTPSANGDYYLISVSGTSSITGTSTAMIVGGRIISNGTEWVYQPPTDSQVNTDSRTTLRGLYSYNAGNAIDAQIANAIKNINLELKKQYQNDDISIRYFGYSASSSGLIIQIYDITTSSVIYTVKLSSDASKPSITKRYVVHLPNEYYIDITIDWSSFATSALQSSDFSIKISASDYDANRNSINQFTNNISSYEVNGIDEKINLAVRKLRFEHVNFANEWAIYQLGWDGTAVYVRFRNKTTSTNLTILLESTGAKPSGMKEYVINLPYTYYINIVVSWDSYVTQSLLSTTYTANIVTTDYDNNRIYPSQLSNGITGFTRNGTDERISLAIKNIYFEYLDGTTPISITQIGWTGSALILKLRNLTTNTNFDILLSRDTAKPIGLKRYELTETNTYYLNLLVDWSSFPSNSILSSTYTTTLQVNPYNIVRNQNYKSLDYEIENIKRGLPKKYTNSIIDFVSTAFEVGSITSGNDSNNPNRIRTKYNIPVKSGTTISYVVAAGYRMILQQVALTNTIKSYTLITDNGTLSGSGTITLATNTENIRIAFIKLAADNTTETKIYSTDVNSTNFSITTDFGDIEPVNSATKFTDNQLMNSFIKEIYIEGLDVSQPYILYHVRRNVSGSWRVYIYNKTTNTSVFSFGSPTADFNETGIFDRTISGVRVRAIFDWSVLPVNYHNLNPTTKINFDNTKIFNLKFSPTISNFYQDKIVRGNKLLSSRLIASIDNNSVANSILPYKNLIPAFMNSMKAIETKASTITTYETIPYAKNGSIGLQINGKLYEFCQERDTDTYDSTSNIFVRVIDIATKTMTDKTKILAFGNTIGGIAMTKIPYAYSGVQIDSNTIRIFIRVQLVTNINKFGYIDYTISTKAFSTFADMTLNGSSFDISSYYSYIRDNVDYTTTNGYGNLNVALSLSKHIIKNGSYYYALIGSASGLGPYTGTYYSLMRSTNATDWTIFHTFSEFKNGQDDSDIYIKNGILYAQLRQSFGTLRSVIVAYNLSTSKEVTSQTVKSATCRGEFFEYNNELYLLVNLDENRQYAVLYKIIFDSSRESLDLITILTTEGWNANWSIHEYDSKICVFFGTQMWEAKIDQYNTSISDALYNLLK